MGRRTDLVSRTLKALRAEGWTAEVVERAGPWGRKDLFGIGDILAIRPSEVRLVQVCGPGEGPAHIRKIAEAELVGAVRNADIEIEVWAWSQILQRKKCGRRGKARRWMAKRINVS